MLAATVEEPVVVLTGLDDERIGVDAVERGAQDYLLKGDLTPKLLRRTVRYAVERERQQRRLERRNDELALLTQLVRHDISIIMGCGDTLREHVDPTGETHLERVLGAGEHITGIAETAGDFLEILEGAREPELQPIALGPLLATEIEKVRAAHESATVTLDGGVPTGLSVAATELLWSVFRNLLNNAVTHNDKQAPTVTVAVERGTETITVHVADNGPGIPERQREEVFGRGEMGLRSPGSGIGLYLVDTLVGTYGGEIHIADNEPEGSVFVVRLRAA